MTRLALFIFVGLLAGCGPKTAGSMPPPFPLTAQATGHYCGMNLLEHKGPKGQIILASQGEPIWFSSARDAFSFTMLPDEPKDIRAVYVSDMARAPSWDDPGFIGSTKQGGMGAPETVPFSDRAAADRFAAGHGGRVVTFDEVPRDYVLGSQPGAPEK